MNGNHLGKELIAVAQGNRKALKNIYLQESDSLYSFALQVLGKDELAQEAVINAFTAIWNNANFYNEKLNARGWIYTIFRYGLNQIARTHIESLHPSPTVVHNIQREMSQFNSDGSFYRVFEELPLHTQTSFLTLYFSPHHIKDVANALSMSEEELRNSIKMGVKHLSAHINDFNNTHPLNNKIGELILGTLSEGEEQELNKKIAIDPEADQFTYQWENLFLEFLKQISTKKTPRNLWLKIQKSLIKNEKVDPDAIKELDENLELNDSNTKTKGSFGSKLLYILKKCWISRNFWRLASLLLLALCIWVIISNPFATPAKMISALNQTNSSQVAYLIKINKTIEVIPSVNQNIDSKSDLKLWHRNKAGLISGVGLLSPNSTSKIKNDFDISVGDTLFITLEPKSAVKSVAQSISSSQSAQNSAPPGPTLFSGKVIKW